METKLINKDLNLIFGSLRSIFEEIKKMKVQIESDHDSAGDPPRPRPPAFDLPRRAPGLEKPVDSTPIDQAENRFFVDSLQALSN